MDKTVPTGAAILLDFIRKTEVGRTDRASYDVIYGNNQNKLQKPITSLTIGELVDAQADFTRRFKSSASGGYQFMRETLQGLAKELGLSGKQVFDPDLQDRLGYHLLKRRGYEKFMAGKISVIEFGRQLAMKWDSFPVLAKTLGGGKDKNGKLLDLMVEQGQSYYAGDPLNKVLVKPEVIEDLHQPNLRDNQSQRLDSAGHSRHPLRHVAGIGRDRSAEIHATKGIPMTTNRNINDVIIEKIHATFIELVPEDELREIVAKAVDDFKTPRQTGDRFNRDIKPSPLEEYVGKAITGLLEKAVAKHIDAALETKLDEHGQRIVSDIIQKAVNDAAPMMIEHFVRNAGTMTAVMMVNNLRDDLRNGAVRF